MQILNPEMEIQKHKTQKLGTKNIKPETKIDWFLDFGSGFVAGHAS